MTTKIIRIVLLEDIQSEIDTFISTASRLSTADTEYTILPYKNLDDHTLFKDIIDGVDYIIVDLKLDGDSLEKHSGNNFLKEYAHKIHIPIIINSSVLPELDDRFNYTNNPLVKQFDHTKSAEDILIYISGIISTGLNKVIGYDGIINNTLQDLIIGEKLSNVEQWRYFTDFDKSINSLGRYVLSHIHHRLAGDYEDFHTEEIYIKTDSVNLVDQGEIATLKSDPTKLKELKRTLRKYYTTGTIIEKSGEYFVILNPACDISQSKQDQFLVAKIQPLSSEEGKLKGKYIIYKTKEQEKITIPNNENELAFKEAKKDYEDYYKDYFLKKDHKNIFVLLKSSVFVGGYVNFRQLDKIEILEIDGYIPKYQISTLFLKNLISEFGYYYSRQGQPDICMNLIIANL